jgi:hypothetical protein
MSERRCLIWRIAIPLALLWAFNAGAADRALIMTISDYRGPAMLPGVKMDAASARKILAGIGFATDHVTTLAAPELTLAGMKEALAKFAAHTGNGDRVFVYFSGHGTSYKVEDHCEQALVSSDMKPLPAQDIFKYIADLRERASRVVLMLDSCFSGGIAETVDLAGPTRRGIDRFTPKYLTLPGQAPNCALPVNVASVQNLGTRDVKGAINLDRNYAVVAAARHDEAAFDDRQNGGVATNAVLECLKNPEADADHSGGVSFAELASCAQDKINNTLPGSDAFRQHIVLTGNEGMTAIAALAPASDATANPRATLHDVLQGADGRWDVQAVASAQRLRIHQDSFQVTVTSSHPGYLYVVYVGSDNQEFLKLYPTRESEPNHLKPEIPFKVPKIWHSEGPAGVDELLVFITPTPRDLASVFGRTLAAPGTYASARGLEESVAGCLGDAGPGCSASLSRNLSATDASGSTGLGYGAALVTVTEVNR